MSPLIPGQIQSGHLPNGRGIPAELEGSTLQPGSVQPFCSFLLLVQQIDLPVRGREILLLLEFLLQAHQLELREDGPTPAWLF